MLLKIWFEKIPDFKPNKETKLPGEIIVAEGVIELERRRIKDEEQLFDFTDAIGLFKRENGATAYGVIESDLIHLQGCRVRVKIEVLEFPKDNSIEQLKRVSELLGHSGATYITHDCEDPTYTETTHKNGTRTLECNKCHKRVNRDKVGVWTSEE